MLISDKQLLGLRVETQAGEYVGHIAGLEIDIESQSILNYLVRPTGFVGGLLGTERIIGRGQVMSITTERMVIEDSAVKETMAAYKKRAPFLSPQGNAPGPIQAD